MLSLDIFGGETRKMKRVRGKDLPISPQYMMFSTIFKTNSR